VTIVHSSTFYFQTTQIFFFTHTHAAAFDPALKCQLLPNFKFRIRKLKIRSIELEI